MLQQQVKDKSPGVKVLVLFYVSGQLIKAHSHSKLMYKLIRGEKGDVFLNQSPVKGSSSVFNYVVT